MVRIPSAAFSLKNPKSWRNVTERAFAKLNLCLHIVGRRTDGYHNLDSLVVFTEFGDDIEIQAAPRTAIVLTGERGAELAAMGGDTLVHTAAERALRHAYETGMSAPAGLSLCLDKRMPIAAGLGGGSADAAATLRGMWQMIDGDSRAVAAQQSLIPVAESLGADVPVCLSPAPARIRGIGHDIMRLPDLPPLDVVLVNPGLHIPTPAVFAALGSRCSGPLGATLPRWRNTTEFATWLNLCTGNDLEAPAIEKVPVIEHVRAALVAQPGALLARMSGSGATCFGIFANARAAEAAVRAVSAAHPNWWAVATRTRTERVLEERKALSR